MVRNLPLESEPLEPESPMSHWEPSEPYGEQYFPRQLSWYAAEGPQGSLEQMLRRVREQPWKAMGVAMAVGFGLALLLGPIARLGAGCTGRGLKRKRQCPQGGGE